MTNLPGADGLKNWGLDRNLFLANNLTLSAWLLRFMTLLKMMSNKLPERWALKFRMKMELKMRPGSFWKVTSKEFAPSFV